MRIRKNVSPSSFLFLASSASSTSGFGGPSAAVETTSGSLGGGTADGGTDGSTGPGTPSTLLVIMIELAPSGGTSDTRPGGPPG